MLAANSLASPDRVPDSSPFGAIRRLGRPRLSSHAGPARGPFSIAMVVAVPFSLGAAIYIAEFAEGRTREILKVLVELLSDWEVDEEAVEYNQLVPTRGVATAPISVTAR